MVSGECFLMVKGLQSNQKYVFAVAAYDSQGKLLGDAIGDTTLPIIACMPVPLLCTWAYLAQVNYTQRLKFYKAENTRKSRDIHVCEALLAFLPGGFSNRAVCCI